MTARPCAINDRHPPVLDGWVCMRCVDQADRLLTEIIEFTPDARAVAAGQVRRGAGGAGGKPGSRSPGNDGAMDAVNEVQNKITTLARDVEETRGPQSAPAPSTSRFLPDPLVAAAKWLSGQLEWLRHAVDDQGGSYAVTAFAEIDQCAGRLRSLVNGPSEKRYLGPCLAPVGEPEGDCPANCQCHNGPYCPCSEPGGCGSAGCGSLTPCDGDMYVRGDATLGRCQTCGATVSRADREAWLDGEVRAHAFRAAQIADAYRVNVKTIRSWAGRGQLKSYRRTDGGLVIPWTDDSTTERLHYVGDVLDLAAADAARRETARATRERRKETAA